MDDIRTDSFKDREDLTAERDTSNLIIEIADVFSNTPNYGEAIMSALEMLSEVLHPDRLLVFERGEESTRCSFEWHDPKIPSQIQHVGDIPNEQFDAMGKLAEGEKAVIMSNASKAQRVDRRIAENLDRRGITDMIAVALRDGGELIGSISANNCKVEDGVDIKRILDTVAPFISSRIMNQRLLNRLEKLVLQDGLTGLLNRRGIDEAIEERLSVNPDQPYALALMDIDDFKVVNDLYGHDVGDAALIALAGVIKDLFPESAIIGRNGGDEFLTMLLGEDAASMGSLLDELRTTKLECEHAGKRYPLSMSVGYAEYPSQVSGLQDAYTKADAALYAVKLAGKSGCKKYEAKHEQQYRAKLGFVPRDIAENSPCGIAVCKMTQKAEILFANDELVEMLGCKSFVDLMDYTGATFTGFIHPDDKERLAISLARQAQSSETGGKAYVDFRVITKSGASKNTACSARLVHIDNVGASVYVFLVDLDERDRVMRGEPVGGLG